MLSAVANGIGSIVTGLIGPEKNSKSRSSRVSYRNHQLIRLFPSTENQVNDLRDLGDTEPEDIKFWTQPVYNKYVFYLLFVLHGIEPHTFEETSMF